MLTPKALIRLYLPEVWSVSSFLAGTFNSVLTSSCTTDIFSKPIRPGLDAADVAIDQDLHCLPLIQHGLDISTCGKRGVLVVGFQHVENIRVLATCHTLRKHAYSNIMKILPPKHGNFSDKKKSDIFHISAQNIDCGYLLEPPRRGGSNEYPQSMFLSRINKNNVYPCKPQFSI